MAYQSRSRFLSLVAATVLSGAAIAWAATKHEVSQKGKKFSVEELTVKVGDVIEFKNDDEVAHNVFSVSAPRPFNTKMQPPGSRAEVSFDKEGKVEVRCAIHPAMRMVVNVRK